MPIRTSVLAIVLCAIGAAALRPPAPVSPPRARAVFGRVIDAGTGKSIDGASIVVESTQIGSKSSASGAFALKNVPSQSARVEFRHPCYFPVQVTTPTDGDVEIEIGLPFDNTSRQRPGCGGLGAREKE